jgi:TonB family protein
MRTFAWLCAASIVLAAAPVEAQEGARRDDKAGKPEPKPEPQLTSPPELLEAADAEYPPDAGEREADVKVRIHIDATGTVTQVDLPEPVGGGFDEAARSAALRYRFKPAEFDGKPGPIVVETVIHFRRNLVPELPEEAPAPGDAAQPGVTPPAGTAVLEGTVKERGTRRNLVGVSVALLDLGRETETDVTGRFRFDGVPAGSHRVVALRTGYIRFADSVSLADGETSDVVLYLRTAGGSPYETIVEADREKLEVTRRTVTRRELTTVPGTFGDPLRVIQNLPGMARSPFALGLLLVRGSDPNDTGVFVDGHSVPLLYHFLGGPSILNPEFLESIDLYPGGFPARFGRFHGGIVDVNTRSPASDGVHGSAKVDVIDSGAYLRAPIGDHVTVAVAGRRSYVDALLPFILPEPDPGDTLVVVPVYWDYQARMDVELPRRSTLSILAFGSDDRLQLLQRSAEEMATYDLDTHIGFHRLRATLTVPIAGDLKLSISPVFGRDALSFSAGAQANTDITNSVLGVRERFSGKLTERLHLDTGIDLDSRVTRFNALLPNPDDIRNPEVMIDLPSEALSRTIDMYGLGLYGEVAWDIGAGVRVIPGLRYDLYLLNGKPRFSFDPRIVARWTAWPKTTFKGYVGLYREAPPPEALDNVFGNPDLKLESAVHTGFGVEQQLTRNISIDAEAYYIARDDLAAFEEGVTERPDGTLQRIFYDSDGVGDTVGLEVLLKHKVTDRFYGWLSYTLSRSTLLRDPEDDRTLTPFDQTHNLIAVASYRLPSGWEFGARIRYSTGLPETPILDGTYDSDEDDYQPVRGPMFSHRRQPFTEINLRVDKTWTFDTWSFGAYLDVINVLNAENPEATQYDYRFRATAPIRGVPIVPTLGLKGQW